MHERTIVLIIGIHQSGTSLLESCIVMHPEAAGLYESLTKDIFKLIGKRFCINKLVTRQIRPKLRSNILFHLFNRIVNFFAKKMGMFDYKILPSSALSVKDYIKSGAKLIIINRNPEDIIISLVERRRYSKRFALKHWQRMDRILTRIISNFEHLYVHYDDLVTTPETTLKKICKYIGLKYDPVMLKGYKINFKYPNDKIVKEKAHEQDK